MVHCVDAEISGKRKTLAVIPARGGSKGIPRKNMRLMHGRPLISYAIETALSSPQIDVVAVTSDSEEILSFASQYDEVVCIDRSSELAKDAVTLDPVVHDALIKSENRLGVTFDNVITLQPTSPLLTSDTLNFAIADFLKEGCDSMISVVNAPHLSWKKDAKGCNVPAYEQRLNRQQLPPNYLETGAFVISRRECVCENSRLGKRVSIFEVPGEESVDIDTYQDWIVCQSILARKKIVFRVDGYSELGLGHIYRALTLAYELIEHEVIFICDKRHCLGTERLKAANMSVVEIAGEDDLVDWLKTNRPDVYIHDCLDTEVSLMRRIKRNVGRLITFEDLGDGARVADAVVNAIYEGDSPHSNTYSGKRYVALRDEFLVAQPNNFSEKVKNVVVLFGGTDPLDLSMKVYMMAKKYREKNPDVAFEFLLGSGYTGCLKEESNPGMNVKADSVRVSDSMKKADLAFSSQGRTTFELASMGVPTIVMAQNERERLHRFAQMDNGFINLGLGSEVSDEDLLATFEWLVNATSVRKEMHRLMIDNDLRSGINRVKKIILGDDL